MEDKYKITKLIGSGAFGSVYRAVNKNNGEIIAAKRILQKSDSWGDCMKTEVKALKKLDNHPNVIKLKEVITDKSGRNLYLIFEHMDCDLHEIIQNNRIKKIYGESQIKKWCYQVICGLDYMHRLGYFHRDLKPCNLLVSESRDVIKIADFGSVREIKSKAPYTNYVTTRHYRAPEILMGAKVYGPAVDMWAVGAILAELFMGRAIFSGKSSDGDQMYQICHVLGTPKDWKEGIELANCMNYKFPQVKVVANVGSLMARASEDAINLFNLLCSWDPSKRPTAAQALQHPFFKGCNPIPRLFGMRTRSTSAKIVPSDVEEGSSDQDLDTSLSLQLPGRRRSERLKCIARAF